MLEHTLGVLLEHTRYYFGFQVFFALRGAGETLLFNYSVYISCQTVSPLEGGHQETFFKMNWKMNRRNA